MTVRWDLSKEPANLEIKHEVLAIVVVKNPHILMSSTFIRRESPRYYQELGIKRFKMGGRMATKNATAPDMTVLIVPIAGNTAGRYSKSVVHQNE
jgi:collagenase-like PrtC family protease